MAKFGRRLYVGIPSRGWTVIQVIRYSMALCLAAACCTVAPAADLTEEDAKALRDAEQAIKAGKFEQAIQGLLPLQKKHPSVGDIPRLLTHAYYETKQFDKARQSAIDAIGVGRVTPDVLARLAQIAQERDDRLALLNALRLVTVLEPGNVQWRIIFGDLLASEQAIDESAVVFRELLREQPDSAALNLRLGNVLMQKGLLSEAAVHLETAWQLGAELPQLPLTIAGVCQQLRDNERACVWVERALKTNPDREESLQLQLAQMQWDLAHVDSAHDWAQGIADSQDKKIRSQAQLLLGHIALKREQTDVAIEHWRKAVDAGEDSSQLLALLGAHHYNAGQFDRAAEILAQAVRAEEGANEQTLRFLILSLVRSDRRPNARPYLRQYLEHHGLTDQARELIRAWSFDRPAS